MVRRDTGVTFAMGPDADVALSVGGALFMSLCDVGACGLQALAAVTSLSSCVMRFELRSESSAGCEVARKVAGDGRPIALGDAGRLRERHITSVGPETTRMVPSGMEGTKGAASFAPTPDRKSRRGRSPSSHAEMPRWQNRAA